MSSKNNVPLTYDSMNQLTGWGSQTYNYDDLGNITSQPLVGQFSYDGFKVDGMTTENNYVIDDSLRITYYKAIERPKSIENEHYKAEFFYDGNGDRYMMKVYRKYSGRYSHYLTRYYLSPNVELTEEYTGNRICMYYAGGDVYTASAVKVMDWEARTNSVYQITRDNLGSVLQYEDEEGTHYFQFSYSPWGVRTHIGDETNFYQPGVKFFGNSYCPIYRTYTGHEDLWMFGLINANARLYSPYLGRFVSPDPLLNSEGGPLLYNPYIYANNNPFKYIDRGGEEPITLTALLIGFAVGGTINVACNWENIHDVGDFCAFFGVGGTAGIAGVAAAALAPAGAIAGALYGAVGGALSGALLGGGNALLLGQDPWKAALTGMWQGAATGVILGGLTGGAKAIDGNKSWLTGSPKVKANPAANISATPKEMLSTPSKGSQPNYPETVNTSDYPNPYYVDGSKEIVTLDKGTVIDRFSPSINELKGGTFFGEPGTSYIERGLLHNPAKGVTYGRWELTQPLQVEKSLVAPIPKFNIPGGGVQYRFLDSTPGSYMNANQMMNKGFIKVMSVPF